MYKRSLNIDNILKRKSIFIFGPRQTGKTTFLNTHYHNALSVNLLKAREFRELAARPETLEQRVVQYLKDNQAQPDGDRIVIIERFLDDWKSAKKLQKRDCRVRLVAFSDS